MIPASTRRSVSSKISTTGSWFKSGLVFGGKTLWVVSTSALLLGVPWALAYSEEQMIVEQERAELMQQRAQNEVSGGDACCSRCTSVKCGLLTGHSLWLRVRRQDRRKAHSQRCEWSVLMMFSWQTLSKFSTRLSFHSMCKLEHMMQRSVLYFSTLP